MIFRLNTMQQYWMIGRYRTSSNQGGTVVRSVMSESWLYEIKFSLIIAPKHSKGMSKDFAKLVPGNHTKKVA